LGDLALIRLLKVKVEGSRNLRIPILLFCSISWLALAQAHERHWDCKEEDLRPIVSASTIQLLNRVVLGQSTEADVDELTRQIAGSASHDTVTLLGALALLHQKLGHNDEAIDIYRRIFEMETATTPERSKARSQLATLLYAKGKVREVIDLYERGDRPNCGEMSSRDAFTLASAYNAARNFSRSEELYEHQAATWEKRSEPRMQMNSDWQLLGFLISFNEANWATCAERLDGLLRRALKSTKLSRQLNAILHRSSNVPQLAATLESAERDGYISKNKVLPSKGVVADLHPIQLAPPKYPPAANDRGIEGYVLVDFRVNARGATDLVDVIDAYPPDTFEQAAAAAALQWRFEPPTRNGEPACSIGQQRIEFRVHK